MSGTWTDTELDAALRELAVAVDPHHDHDAALAGVRERLTAAADRDDLTAEVVQLGADRRRPTSRRRWGPALLVAAALVAVLTLAAVFWPRGDDRAEPLGPGPTTTSSASPVHAQLALLPEPLPPVGTSYTVITSTSGVGDRTVPFTPVTRTTDVLGNPLRLAYNLTCGDPGVDAGAPPRGDVVVRDDIGVLGHSSCNGLADGRYATSTLAWSPDAPTGHDRVTVDVPADDVVWKLTVTVQSVR